MKYRDLDKIHYNLLLAEFNEQCTNLAKFLSNVSTQSKTENLINFTQTTAKTHEYMDAHYISMAQGLVDEIQYVCENNISKDFTPTLRELKLDKALIGIDVSVFLNNTDTPENLAKRQDVAIKIKQCIVNYIELMTQQTEIQERTSSRSLSLFNNNFRQLIQQLELNTNVNDSIGTNHVYNEKFKNNTELIGILNSVKGFLKIKEDVLDFENYLEEVVGNKKSILDNKLFKEKSLTDLKREYMTISEIISTIGNKSTDPNEGNSQTTADNTKEVDSIISYKGSQYKVKQVRSTFKFLEEFIQKRVNYENSYNKYLQQSKSPYALYRIDKIKKMNKPLYEGEIYIADAYCEEKSFTVTPDKVTIPVKDLMYIEKTLNATVLNLMSIAITNYIVTLYKKGKLNYKGLSTMVSDKSILDEYSLISGTEKHIPITIEFITALLYDTKFFSGLVSSIEFYKMTIDQLFDYLSTVYKNITQTSQIPGKDSTDTVEQLIYLADFYQNILQVHYIRKLNSYNELRDITPVSIRTLILQKHDTDSIGDSNDSPLRILEHSICFYNKEYSAIFCVPYYQNEALGNYDVPSFEGFKYSVPAKDISSTINTDTLTHYEWILQYISVGKSSIMVTSNEANYPKLFKDVYIIDKGDLLRDNDITHKLYSDSELSSIVLERVIFDSMKMGLQDKHVRELSLQSLMDTLYCNDTTEGYLTDVFSVYRYSLDSNNTEKPLEYFNMFNYYSDSNIILNIASSLNYKDHTYKVFNDKMTNKPHPGRILTAERSLIIKLLPKYTERCKKDLGISKDEQSLYITPFTLQYVFDKYKREFLEEYYMGLTNILKDIINNFCDEFIGAVNQNPVASSYVSHWLSDDTKVIEGLRNNIPVVEPSAFNDVISINSSTVESILNFFILIQKAQMYKTLLQDNSADEFTLRNNPISFKGFFEDDLTIKSEYLNVTLQDIWGYSYIKSDNTKGVNKCVLFNKVANVNLSNGDKKYDLTALVIRLLYSLYGYRDIICNEQTQLVVKKVKTESEVSKDMTNMDRKLVDNLTFVSDGERIGGDSEGISSWFDECKSYLLKSLGERGETVDNFDGWFNKYIQYMDIILNSITLSTDVKIDKGFMICFYVTNLVAYADLNRPLLDQLVYNPIENIPSSLSEESTPNYVELVDLVTDITSADSNIRLSEVMLDVEGIAPASTEELRTIAESFYVDKKPKHIYDLPIVNDGLEILTRYVFSAKDIANVSVNAFIDTIRDKEALEKIILVPDLVDIDSSTAQSILYHIGLPSKVPVNDIDTLKITKVNLTELFDINIYKQIENAPQACAVRDIILLNQILSSPNMKTAIRRKNKTLFAKAINNKFESLKFIEGEPKSHEVYQLLKHKQLIFKDVLTDEMINNTWSVFLNKTKVLTHHPIERGLLENRLYDVIAETTFNEIQFDDVVFKSTISHDKIDEAKESLRLYSSITILSNSMIPYISMVDFLKLNEKYNEAKSIIEEYIDVASQDVDKDKRKSRIIYSMALRDTDGLSMLNKSILDNIDFRELTTMDWFEEQMIASPYSPREQLVQYNLIDGIDAIVEDIEQKGIDDIHPTVYLDYCLELQEYLSTNGLVLNDNCIEVIYSRHYSAGVSEEFKQKFFELINSIMKKEVFLNKYKEFKSIDVESEYFSILSQIENYLQETNQPLDYLKELPTAINQYVSNYEFQIPAQILEQFKNNQKMSVLRPKYVVGH